MKRGQKRAALAAHEEFVVDSATGHVLPVALVGKHLKRLDRMRHRNEEAMFRETEAQSWFGASAFLRGARRVHARGDTEVFRKKGFFVVRYEGGDRWGGTFTNCRLVLPAGVSVKEAAEALGLRVVEGAVEEIFRNYTGLIDGNCDFGTEAGAPDGDRWVAPPPPPPPPPPKTWPPRPSYAPGEWVPHEFSDKDICVRCGMSRGMTELLTASCAAGRAG
jgi:hypothetical protein